MKKIIIFAIPICCYFISLSQGTSTSWERTGYEKQILELFHSPYAITLPTGETKSDGDFLFEVSHRFIPTVKNEGKNFLGLDGPANIRLAFGYSLTDRLMINLGHSNLFDNTEIQAKYKTLEFDNSQLPMVLSFQAGLALNREIHDPVKNYSRRFQYYGQLIFNTLIKEKFGIGLVPTYLDNAYIFCKEKQYTLALGTYYQYYLSEFLGIILEWTPTIAGWQRWHNSASLALEIETGGHFFKLLFTNNTKMNLANYLTGAGNKLSKIKDWHFGFFISRTF